MQIENYELVGSYNNQRFPNIDAERTINMFEYIDLKGKKPKALISTSGILNTDFTFEGAAPTDGFRGEFVLNNFEYYVIGPNIYRRDINNVIIKLNAVPLTTNAGYVGIDANNKDTGSQILFVDGQVGCVWDTGTNTFTPNVHAVDANFPLTPIDVFFIDGFLGVAVGGTNTFVLSQLNNALLYTPLQLGAINSHPGNIVACRTLHRRIFLFSTNYTEVWENAGAGTNLPLRRNNSLLMEYGTPAIGSIVTGFDKMMFLSQDRDGLGAVMQVTGTESIPISNRALDFQLAQYAANGQINDARGIFIKENGIIFYRLNFTTANHTYVYNVTFSNPTVEEEKRWHEEQVLNGDRHPAQTHGYFNGNNFFGAYNKPILYQVDPQFVTNDGETIPRIRIGRPYVSNTYNRIRTDRFMVDIVQGLPDFTNDTTILDLLAEDSNPILTESDLEIILELSGSTVLFNPNDHVIYLSISKDGGVTYNYRQSATVGAIGNRTHRTVWRKLGVIPRGQAFVPKIEFYAHIPFIILGAAWAFEVLPE